MERLRKRADFLKAAKGKRSACRTLSLQYLAGEATVEPQVGLTVSRHVGNAVKRSRVKRKLRAQLRALYREKALPPGLLVVVAREAAYPATSQDLLRDLRYCLKRL